MEGPNSSSPAIYPPYLFRHSPTYSSWARLTAADVHNRLQQEYPSCGLTVKDLWYFGNHPIRWVRIVGIVVAFEEWEKRVQITVDDGSGEVIEATAWKPFARNAEPQAPPRQLQPAQTPPNFAGVHVHAVVKVKGTINEFRGRKQMLLRKVEVLKDTADEVQCWHDMVTWKRTVLMQPWVVDGEIARKEERAWAKEERRRLKHTRKIGTGKPGGSWARREEGDKNQYRGRRRPEGYVPPPRRSKPAPPPLATAKDRTARGEAEDTSAQQPSWFRGRRRPADYVPPPRPPVPELAPCPSPDNAGPRRAADDYSDLAFGAELKASEGLEFEDVMEVTATSRDAKDRSARDQQPLGGEPSRRGGGPFGSPSSPRPVKKRKMLNSDFSDLDFGEPQPPGQDLSHAVLRTRKSARSAAGHRRVREAQDEISLSQPEFVVSTSINGDPSLHPSKSIPSSSCRDHRRSAPAPDGSTAAGSQADAAARRRTKNRDSKPASVEHDACTSRLHPTEAPAALSRAHNSSAGQRALAAPTQQPSPSRPPPTRPQYIPSTISTYYPSPTQFAEPPPSRPPPTRPQYIGGIPSTISTYYPSPTQSTEPPPSRPPLTRSQYIDGIPSTISTYHPSPAQSAKLPPSRPPLKGPQYMGGIPSTISTYYPSPTQPAKPPSPQPPTRPQYVGGFPSPTSAQPAKPAFRGRRRNPPPLPKPRAL